MSDDQEVIDIASVEEAADEPSATAGASFTIQEMMDEDMMVEFQASDMPVPTAEEFATKVLQLKKLALKHKQQGDITQATKHLRYAKQLEKVQQALMMDAANRTNKKPPTASEVPVDEPTPVNELTGLMGPENYTAEETALLRELFEDDDHDGSMVDEEADLLLSSPTSEVLSVEEIESMDDRDLIDFVIMMGQSSLPTVSQLQDRAVQQQKQAINCKQSGNLNDAKLALLNSKRAKSQADRLQLIYANLDKKASGLPDESTNKELSLDDLEALVNGGEKRGAAPKPKTGSTPKQIPASPQDPWLSKPSAEIKLEVIRLKNAQQIKEATQMLQTLKTVLQREREEAEANKASQLIEGLRRELYTCQTQIRLWQYYSWFVDSTVGTPEYDQWSDYAVKCERAIQLIESKGSTAVTLSTMKTTTLHILADDVVTMVEQGNHVVKERNDKTSDLDGELEVAVLGLLEMEKNEKLQRTIKKRSKTTGDRITSNPVADCPYLRIDTKIQLPLNVSDPTQPLHIEFSPTSSQRNGSKLHYEFDADRESSRQKLPLPKPGTKEGKALLRRMETKTLQFSILLTSEPPPKEQTVSSSWFFGGKKQSSQPASWSENDESNKKDTLLGKVVVELKGLLTRNCVAGEFPLSTNHVPSGGIIRLCLRTTPALTDAYEGAIAGTAPSASDYKSLEISFNS